VGKNHSIPGYLEGVNPLTPKGEALLASFGPGISPGRFKGRGLKGEGNWGPELSKGSKTLLKIFPKKILGTN